MMTKDRESRIMGLLNKFILKIERCFFIDSLCYYQVRSYNYHIIVSAIIVLIILFSTRVEVNLYLFGSIVPQYY